MTSCSFSCSKELETVVQVSSDGVFTLDSSVSTRTRLQPWEEKQYLKNKIKIWTSYNENKKLWNENYLKFFYVLEIQWTFPLPKLPISPCLSTPRDPSLSMSIYSQSFLSLHVYLLPEIPLYLCLFTPRASYLSMSIYSRRSLSIYVYSLPELPISPCLSTPGDPSLFMSIYSWSPFVLHLYLFPELLLSPYLSTLRSVLLCYLPLLMCPALSTRCYWENMPWCCWQLGNLTTSYNIYWCIMFYYFPRPG